MVFQVQFPEILVKIEFFHNKIAATIADLLQRGQKDGSVRQNIDPLVVGKIIQGTLVQLANPRFLLTERLSNKQIASNWQNLLLHGLKIYEYE